MTVLTSRVVKAGYNTFTMANISPVEQVAGLLQVIGQATRLQILLAVGEGETCVCHLEAMLGLRQAALSQHLMALREAGLVSDRREGRYIYYRLCDPALLNLIRSTAQIRGLELPALSPSPDCECPQCCERRIA
jgi:DNA-binding transcriptional ArsR family regulator